MQLRTPLEHTLPAISGNQKLISQGRNSTTSKVYFYSQKSAPKKPQKFVGWEGRKNKISSEARGTKPRLAQVSRGTTTISRL